MGIILQYWEIIVGAFGLLSAPIMFFLGGKQKQNVELKKSNADAVGTMQSVYDQFLADYKNRMVEVMSELSEVKETNKTLQKQFNEITISYAREVEMSQNWEKLHRELKDKYNILEGQYEKLKEDHDKLKKDFDKYKKEK
jgi:phage shock protein A